MENKKKILKLVLFQILYLMLNLEKHAEFEEKNWFYKFFQFFYESTCIFLNIDEDYYKNNIICFPDNNLNKSEFKIIYKYIFEYIKNNKKDYSLSVLS